MSENSVALEKVTIPVGNDIVGIFYFETKEEAEKFKNDVITFVNGIRDNSEKAVYGKEKIVKKYSRTKSYSNFFKALEMKLKGNVKEEPHQ